MNQTTSKRRMDMRELLICHKAGESLTTLSDPVVVELVADKNDIEVDEHNLIAEVGGAVTIGALAEALRARRLYAPVMLLPATYRLCDVAARFAPLLDKALHHARIATAAGTLLASPRAPRSAVGPDPLGLLFLQAPGAFLVQAGLSLFPESACRGRRLQGGDPHDLFGDVMQRTHAAMVMREGADVVVYDHHNEDGPMPPVLDGVTACAALTPLSTPPGTDEPVVGLPHAGRVLRFTRSAPAPVVVPDAAMQLHRALAARAVESL